MWYLFIIFSEECSIGTLVDGLCDPDDLSITVVDRHAQQRLGFIYGEFINLITETMVLQNRTRDNQSQLNGKMYNNC